MPTEHPESDPTVPDQFGESWFVPRTGPHLLHLPVVARWEVTRRHPYYIRFWHQVREHYRNPAPPGTPAHASAEGAKLVLAALGFSGEPPPPDASAEDLGATTLAGIWADGSISPLTYRGLAGLLLAGLPAPALEALAGLFADAARCGVEGPARLYDFVDRLHRLGPDVLDRVPPRAVVALNAHAPVQRIVDAVRAFAQELKAENDLPDTRRRDDKLADYLAVWDAREGWAGRGYDPGREQTLRDIAAERRKPLSTVANQYTTAFRWIVGRDYSPELWARLFGFYKLGLLHDPNELPARYRSGLTGRAGPAPVPESRLIPRGRPGTAGPVNTAGVDGTEMSLSDLVSDIQALIARGLDNETIVSELELTSQDALTLVEYFRQRHVDTL